jgi:hypothetical protein
MCAFSYWREVHRCVRDGEEPAKEGVRGAVLFYLPGLPRLLELKPLRMPLSISQLHDAVFANCCGKHTDCIWRVNSGLAQHSLVGRDRSATINIAVKQVDQDRQHSPMGAGTLNVDVTIRFIRWTAWLAATSAARSSI